jgi:hypothetical protein
VSGSVEYIQPVAANSRDWTSLPGTGLRLNGVLRPAFAPPFTIPGVAVQVGTLRDAGDGVATLCLVEAEDRDAVVAELESRRAALTMTAIVVVRGAEPPELLAPLNEAMGWAVTASTTRFGTLPEPARDPSFYAPIVAAEVARGNTGQLQYGSLHDTRTGFAFRFPIDEEAILAEFEFDAGMEFEHRPYPVIMYDGEWGVGGASGPSDGDHEAARAEWWREWRAAPRPRVLLRNPFREASGG